MNVASRFVSASEWMNAKFRWLTISRRRKSSGTLFPFVTFFAVTSATVRHNREKVSDGRLTPGMAGMPGEKSRRGYRAVGKGDRVRGSCRVGDQGRRVSRNEERVRLTMSTQGDGAALPSYTLLAQRTHRVTPSPGPSQVLPALLVHVRHHRVCQEVCACTSSVSS